MRYFWASMAAVAIIALGSLFVWRTRVAVERLAREQLAAKGDRIPADSTPVNLERVGLEMSGPQIAMVSFADLLVDFRSLSIVLVILICFGTAALSGRGRRPLSQSLQNRSTEHVEGKSADNAAGS
jgi:hypothetical protein